MTTEQSIQDRIKRIDEIAANPNQTEDEKAEGLELLTELYNTL